MLCAGYMGSLDRFLNEWIILPNSTFWRIWEIVILLSILVALNGYISEIAYSSYYSTSSYGGSAYGNFKLIFGYCLEVVFVVDIFISMKTADRVHMRGGELLVLKVIGAKYLKYGSNKSKIALL